MKDLPVPVIIGLSMVTVGLAIGVWIAVTMITASRNRNNLVE